MTVVTASSAPPVSSATRNDGASKDMRSQGTATTASDTAAAPAAANDTVGSAGLRAGPCSICSTLRTSEPGGVVPEAINQVQGALTALAGGRSPTRCQYLCTSLSFFTVCGGISGVDLPIDGK